MMKMLKNSLISAGIGQAISVVMLLLFAVFLLKSDQPQLFYLPLSTVSGALGAVVCGIICGLTAERTAASGILTALLLAASTLLFSFFPGSAEKSFLEASIIPLLQLAITFGGTLLVQKMKNSARSSSRRKRRR